MRRFMVIAAACIAFAASTANAELYTVTGKAVVVRKGPAASEPAVSSVKKNQVIDGSMLGPWVRVQLSDETQGYISAKFLKPAADGATASPIAGPSIPQHQIKVDRVELKVPVVTSIISRSQLRKESSDKGLIYRYLEKGEEVSILGGGDGWAKVESKWKFESGKPMIGYVRYESLPLDTVGKAGLKVAVPAADTKSEDNKPVKKVENPPPLVSGGKMPSGRVVSIIPAEPVVNTKVMEDAKNLAIAQAKALQVENAKLMAENIKRSGEIKSIQSALANADSRFREADSDRQKLSGELKVLKDQYAALQAQFAAVADGGKSKLLVLADRGEAVFFKGVGEAVMAAAEGKTILRFPLTTSSKADKAFMGAKAERHLQGAYAYYILDSKLLAF